MKKLFVFFSALFWFSPAFTISFNQIPKLNLLVHKTTASKEMSGWLFEVQNFDDYAVRVSDLEIRFWVYQPEGQLFGLRFKDGQWKNLKGVVDGEAVMCAFLSPPYEAVASRKANYAIRYRSAEETLIPPGKSWKNIRIGFAVPDIGLYNQGDYSQKPASQGRLGEPGWFNGMYEDSHFCLYFRGVLVKEWVSTNKPDPNTGAEPDLYKTRREKLALPQMPVQSQQPALNPAYARMPALSEPMRMGDDARYVVVNGSMINVRKAKQEIQNYLMQHPMERASWNRPQNPRIIPASIPPPSSPLSGFSYDNAGNPGGARNSF